MRRFSWLSWCVDASGPPRLERRAVRLLGSCRACSPCRTRLNLARAGVEVLADSFALRERAIEELVDGVQPAEIERLVGLVTEGGVKAMWH